MKPKRRALRGRPLLVAGAGATVLVGGAGCITTGNLVAPPRVELCVTISPADADATVSFNHQPLPEGSLCAPVYLNGPTLITATAEGFAEYSREVQVDTEGVTHDIVLTETASE